MKRCTNPVVSISLNVFFLSLLFLGGIPLAALAAPADKAADKSAKPALVDINTASAKDLEELPGVGPATAAKIIENRPYSKLEDLSKVGMSANKLAKLQGLVAFGAPAAEPKAAEPKGTESKGAEPKGGKIDLNSASAKELEELPGVGAATARKIIENRPYVKIDDLSKTGLSAAKIAKLEPLVQFGAPAVPSAPAVPDKADPKTPTPAPAPPSVPASATPDKVDLNGATAKELEELPGVGPATAKKIIDGRPYKNIGDLEKLGINKKTVEKIEPLVTIATAAAPTPAATPEKKHHTDSKTGDSKSDSGSATPNKGDVWVNTESGIYHKEKSRWYGKTKSGKYMTEEAAKAAGYREEKE